MIEFLWVLLLMGSLVGLSSAPARSMKIRWGLAFSLLAACAAVYIWHNRFLRVALNLLLFFDRHTILIAVLLTVSALGFVFAWHGQLTRRGVVGATLVGVAVMLLVVLEWSCALIILLGLSALALLWARGAKWRPLAWICALMITVLIAGLYVSHLSYGVPDTRPPAPEIGPSAPGTGPDTTGYLKAELLLAAIAIGLLCAWAQRLWLLVAMCASIIGIIGTGLVLPRLSRHVPSMIDTMGDYLVFALLLAFIAVAVMWVLRAQWQPLGWVSAVMILFLGGGLLLSSMLYGEPEDFADIEDQFKYGSIGSDHFLARGIPYFIWQALPRMFEPTDILMGQLPTFEGVNKEDYRPRYGKEHSKGRSYEAFGLLKEEHKTVRLVARDRDVETIIDRPIGFSKRTVFGLDFVGINCAFCHASTIRTDNRSARKIVLGMPANTVDIELFFLFLFGAAEQEGFTSARLMEQILSDNPGLKLGSQISTVGMTGLCQEMKNGIHRLAYRWMLIPLTRTYAQWLKSDFFFIDPTHPDHLPRFGPGRVDAWSPGKRTLIKPPLPVVYPGGIIDNTSIWNQKARNGMRFHWDGNTNDIDERNIIAGLVVNGPQVECLDVTRVKRITDWIMDRPPPRVDDFFRRDDIAAIPHQEAGGYLSADLNPGMVEQGRRIFQQWCASCHAPNGDRVGRVEPLDSRELDTDPARSRAFTAELQNALNTIGSYGRGEADGWKLRKFRTQNGYVNMLLDGIWLRAPYLHNGSVPTLWDLLNPPCEALGRTHCRPLTFSRGDDTYDWKNVGFTLRIEPHDALEVEIQGTTQTFTVPEPQIHGGDVTVGVMGLTGAEAASYLDQQQGLTAMKQRQLTHRLNNLLQEESSKIPDAVVQLLQEEIKLDSAEARRLLRSTEAGSVVLGKITSGNRSLIQPKDVEGLAAEALKWNPLVTVQIKREGVFTFDARLPGNGNRGHLYGTELNDGEKHALIEFLKTL